MTIVIRQNSWRYAWTTIWLFSALTWFIPFAAVNSGPTGKDSLPLAGWICFSLLLFIVPMLLALRAFREGVYVSDDSLISRRILGSNRVSFRDIETFQLKRSLLGNTWVGSIILADGSSVKLPFIARSIVRDDPKNSYALGLMKQVEDAISDRLNHRKSVATRPIS